MLLIAPLAFGDWNSDGIRDNSRFMPKLLKRKEWGAKPTLPNGIRHRISYITIHHAGVATNFKRTLKDKLVGLQAFSQREDKLADGRTKPAWIDIPYHYYIDWQGHIGEGRPVQWAGDTNTEYNPKGHFLIVLEGSFDTEKPTQAQLKAAKNLTQWAMERYSVPVSKVATHKDYAKTDCPGANLYRWMDWIRSN